MAYCDNCHAGIVWAEVTLPTKENRRWPFDDPPAENGPSSAFKRPDPPPAHLRRWVVLNGKARRATDEDRRLHRPLHVLHFDTCTQSRSR